MAQVAHVTPFPPRTGNSPQRPNSALPPVVKEAAQGQQQTGQFKLECWSLGKLVALLDATRTPSCQLCFHTDLCLQVSGCSTEMSKYLLSLFCQ